MYREVRELFWNGQWKDVLCLVVTMIINIINKHKSLLQLQPHCTNTNNLLLFCLFLLYFQIYLKQHFMFHVQVISNLILIFIYVFYRFLEFFVTKYFNISKLIKETVKKICN